MRALILAGGSGTRFWPVSRSSHPKQLVSLWGDKSMLAHTIERVASWGRENVFVIAGESLRDATIAASGLPDAQHFFEPTARNTCAAIVLGCVHLDDDDIVAVMPSDHFVRDDAGFRAALASAEPLARAGFIVTIGIEPTRPETGFGYIRVGEAVDGGSRVRQFVEKPTLDRAIEYLAQGDYLWNAGIFVFRVGTFLEELERQKPEMAASAARMRVSPQTIPDEFPKMESISVDYAVMENARNMAVIPGRFGWSDVGHWAALDEVQTADTQGNVASQNTIVIDTSDSIVFSNQPHRIVAVVGMTGVVVADTEDATLVIPRSKAQDVRKVVDALKASGRAERT
ncbi:MAG: sugar phosphate nucleotidyltransferase [bacterium]